MPVSSSSSRLRSDEQAVTAVIGTVLVLAITVVSIALALGMGAPVVQRLQDKAALETAIGEFEQARQGSNVLALANSSRITTLLMPAGFIDLNLGTHFLITKDIATACWLNVTDWADWSASTAVNVTLGTTGCSSTVYIQQWANGTWESLSHTNGLLAGGNTFRNDRDYRFNLTGNASEAWLLHTARLSWSRTSISGTTSAHLEGGTLFSRESGFLYRVGGPRVDEGDADSFSLSLPLFQNVTSGLLPTGDDHNLYVRLDHRSILNSTADVARVRIDIHGDLAEGWCNAFLQRDDTVPLTGRPYTVSATRPCSPSTPPSDGIRGVVYDPPSLTTFPFQLGRTILYASLQI